MEYAIDSKEEVLLGGLKQHIRLRSTDIKLPLILSLHGGPGGCDRFLMMRFYRYLAGKATLVCWDQRGSGLSYNAGISPEQMTIERIKEDTNELVDYLLNRFKQKKLFILGHSWGTLLGCYYTKQYSEKVAAFIGCGQLVSAAQSESISYQKIWEEAKERNDKYTLRKLGKIGKPVNGCYSSNIALLAKRQIVNKYGGNIHKITSSNKNDLVLTPAVLKEYSLIGVYKLIRGFLFSWNSLRDNLMKLDLREDVNKLDAPVYLIEGIYDNTTPYELAQQWFDMLRCPLKKFITFERSAHAPIFEESEKFGKELYSIISDNIG
jgi:pimeloyl-ACP methyl ester carboxylesterase